jgi:hypothetical protein
MRGWTAYERLQDRETKPGQWRENGQRCEVNYQLQPISPVHTPEDAPTRGSGVINTGGLRVKSALKRNLSAAAGNGGPSWGNVAGWHVTNPINPSIPTKPRPRERQDSTHESASQYDGTPRSWWLVSSSGLLRRHRPFAPGYLAP